MAFGCRHCLVKLAFLLLRKANFQFHPILAASMRLRLLLAFISLFYLFSLIYSERARAVLDGSDSWGYYVHLPSFLLYGDAGDYAKTIAAWQANYPNKPDPRKDAYGLRPTPSGKVAVKYPLGVALLETPFFLVAHVYCIISGTHSADGFSAPYAWAIALSSLFFALLGLFFLFKSLRFYFSENISLAATAAIGLGTNLFFFVAYTPGMSHPVAFCLIAYLLLATRKWHENPSKRNGLAIGFVLGMIAIVRTQDLIVALVPLLWGIRNLQDIPTRFRFFWVQKVSIGAAVLAFVSTLLPQALYWKYVSGQWWRYGYQGEKFDWANPHIREGLLGFQNGWLVYTPLMLFALWGLFYLRRYASDLLVPILVFLPLHWFVSYSWWCWMYINGFGSRPMVDVYVLLAFPLAAWMAAQKKIWILIPLFCAFVGLNIFQTWQTQQGIFWSERGNWAFYKESFGQINGSERALSAFECGEVQAPTALKMSKSLMAFLVNPADTQNVQVAGRLAHPCKGEFHQTTTLSNETAGLIPGDWLRISVSGFVPAGQPAHSIDDIAKLVADFTNGEGKTLKYRAINIATHLSNPRFILWKTRGMGEWGEASFYVQVPMGFDAGGKLKTYIWNPKGQEIFVGDLKLELWK